MTRSPTTREYAAKTPVDFCLDLGGDSIKVAFAFRNTDGKTVFGKVDTEGDIADVGIPAVVFYDEITGNWLYGEEVDAARQTSFITVVRIKDLLSLLREDGASGNADYYRNGEYFPKFYFPVRRGALDNFDKLVSSDRAFRAEGFTPQKICENYFCHIRDIIERRLPEVCALMPNVDARSAWARISVVHSPNSDDSYIAELERLVRVAFGADPFKRLSSTKALSMYAYTYNYLSSNDEMLVFDLGEETLSVAKAVITQGVVTTEGEDGHNTPEKLGGIDIDEALVKHIEASIAARETPGTPSFGNEGHLSEGGLQSKQYLLMKDLKQAKVLLSRPLTKDSVFKNGVPISVWRELCIQRKITREQLTACLGIDDCSGVAEKIVGYVLSELSRPINENVHKICLSGGIVKTYMLAPFIDRKIRENGYRVEFVSLAGKLKSDNDLTIFTYEDTAYAPAVGGAIVALNDYDVKTTLSLSYGTFVHKTYRDRSGKTPKLLKIFVDRGEFLRNGENRFMTDGRISLNTAEGAVNDIFYSTILTRADALEFRYERKDYLGNGITYLYGQALIDEVGSLDFKRAEKAISLRVVVQGDLILKYRGERVNIRPAKFVLREGISVDGRGRAKPIIENLTQGMVEGVMEFYKNKSLVPYKTERVRIPASDIAIEFDGSGFKVAAD